MKNLKLRKILLTICSAMLLVTLSVGATFAYLTSQATVTNTFTVGNVAITMDEAAIKDVYGEKDAAADRVMENKYKLIPAHKYDKDPTIHVDANSEDCYLFVKIENGISAIEAAGDTTIAAQMAAKGWDVVNDAQGIYAYCDAEGNLVKNTKSADVVVFETFTLANDADVANYVNATIAITAYAVQADGFENKPVTEVWNAAFGTTSTN